MGRKKGDPRRSTIAQQIVGFENSETKDVDINKCRTRVRKSVVFLFSENLRWNGEPRTATQCSDVAYLVTSREFETRLNKA